MLWFNENKLNWRAAFLIMLVIAVIATGITLFLHINTPWWQRPSVQDEATLGIFFLLHGPGRPSVDGALATRRSLD